jgi:hypothetical protein
VTVTTPPDPDGGYQSGLPNYPAAPPPSDTGLPEQVYPPPREIVVSFWCYLVAAAIVLVNGLVSIGSKQAVVTALHKTSPTLTPSQLDSAATGAVAIAVVLAAIFAGLYVLFAFKLRAGRNWARIVLTVIAALDLLTLVSGTAGTVVGYIGALAAVIGCVMSYMANSNGYIRAVKAARYTG